VLHSFNNKDKDGLYPQAALIFGAKGSVFGTTYHGGGHNYGTVFELMPAGGGGWTEKVAHSFNNNGKDGVYPQAALIFDAKGNLYGTVGGGGTYSSGMVFELTPKAGGSWTESVLHNFNRAAEDGANPYAALILDAKGNLYGTTYAGGVYNYGTVFELTPKAGGSWTDQVLHSFNYNGTDGVLPYGGLIIDAGGNLYGTTYAGGTYHGTVFELTPTGGGSWTEQVLHEFFNNQGTDGGFPESGLIRDAAGNLYGTTSEGGAYGSYGTVFELTPAGGGSWTEQVLHSFNYNGTDGMLPDAGLIMDSGGNLYGTTTYGGTYNSGTVFELTPAGGGSWTEQVLHNFNNNGTDGFFPVAGLIFDAAGNLYGTTRFGGSGPCESGENGCGTIYELSPSASGWTEGVLHNFSPNGEDGTNPYAGLIFDAKGNLYGTTYYGGTYNSGIVFELTPVGGGSWAEKVLHSFNSNGSDGANPIGGLIFDAKGNLYGTTYYGGAYNFGTVFEVKP